MRKKLTIMVEEALTLEAKKKCLDKGISLSDLVNELIENYLNSSSNNDENNLKYLDFNLVNASEHILTNNNFRDDAHLNDSGVKIVDKYMIDHGYLN